MVSEWSIRSDTYSGCKVRYLKANGYDHDTISANQYLVSGQIYTIDFEIVIVGRPIYIYRKSKG